MIREILPLASAERAFGKTLGASVFLSLSLLIFLVTQRKLVMYGEERSFAASRRACHLTDVLRRHVRRVPSTSYASTCVKLGRVLLQEHVQSPPSLRTAIYEKLVRCASLSGRIPRWQERERELCIGTWVHRTARLLGSVVGTCLVLACVSCDLPMWSSRALQAP